MIRVWGHCHSRGSRTGLRMVRSRTSLSVSSPSCPLCERHHREVPGTLMTCLLIVAPSTPIAGWCLSSSRGNYTTRPSDLHHDGQLWSLNLITSCLWALSGGQCDQLDSDDPRGAGRGTMRATQSPRLRPQGVAQTRKPLGFRNSSMCYVGERYDRTHTRFCMVSPHHHLGSI